MEHIYMLISLLFPALISIAIIYLHKKRKKEKFKSKTQILFLYIISTIIINTLMSFGLYQQYYTELLDFEFNKIFSIKYIALSSLFAIILPLVFNEINKIKNKIIKINKKYKILNIKINYSNKSLLTYLKEDPSIIYNTLYFTTGITFFYIIDIVLRRVSNNINYFVDLSNFCPNMLTISFAILFTTIIYYLPKLASKIVAIMMYITTLIIFITNYMLLKIKSEALSIYDLHNAGEGFEYINFIVEQINKKLILLLLGILLLIGINYFFLSKIKKKNKKRNFKIFAIITISCIFTYSLGILSLKEYDPAAWEAITEPKYYYDNFVNPKKSLTTLGIYEYTLRDIYLYFKDKNSTYGSIEDIERLISENKIEYKENEMTGIFKDKNLIMIMMESIDYVVANEKAMPTLNYLMNNGLNFTSRYNALSSGGSTIMTEYISLTGIYHSNKYYSNVNNNYYPYSVPSQFANLGYKVSSIHENKGVYYNRELLHKNLGFQNSYFIYDMFDNPKIYEDAQIIENDLLYNSIINKDEKFMSLIITIAGHGPYDNTNWICKKENPDMSEIECFNYLAKRTDEMLKKLLERLEADDLLDDTVIVLYTDHQAYSYNYTEEDLKLFTKIDDKYSIKRIPFVIYSKDITPTKYNDILVNDVDIVPTIMNLFGIKYNPNYYIGRDVFSKDHKNLIMFNDYSWYDGNIYSNDLNIDKTTKYYSETTNYVKNRIDLSNMILNNNYYTKTKEKEK